MLCLKRPLGGEGVGWRDSSLPHGRIKNSGHTRYMKPISVIDIFTEGLELPVWADGWAFVEVDGVGRVNECGQTGGDGGVIREGREEFAKDLLLRCMGSIEIGVSSERGLWLVAVASGVGVGDWVWARRRRFVRDLSSFYKMIGCGIRQKKRQDLLDALERFGDEELGLIVFSGDGICSEKYNFHGGITRVKSIAEEQANCKEHKFVKNFFVGCEQSCRLCGWVLERCRYSDVVWLGVHFHVGARYKAVDVCAIGGKAYLVCMDEANA